MPRLLGPVILALLAAVSLWFMQERDLDGEAPPVAPTQGTTALPSTAIEAAPNTQPAPAKTTPVPPSVTAESSAAGELVEPDGIPVDPTAPAIPRDQEQAARFATYEAAAAAFLTDFARPAPSVPEAQWWAQVRPHFSAAAAEVYAGTDPQMVPFTKVTGAATILPTTAPSHLLMLARVPTDAGHYLVEMEADAAGIHVTRAIPEVRR